MTNIEGQELTEAEIEALAVAARSTNLWVSDLQMVAIGAEVKRILAHRLATSDREARRDGAVEALREAAADVAYVREHGINALAERDHRPVRGHPYAEHFESWLLERAGRIARGES